ncbi:MAG TPA: primosomal protein N', partial [Plasticicumulans sp.]|nr:primosomal protein N' [Plasticicumulans sp.]HNI23091.1 primosomal protein N' [Plasticicumulans sp.]HNK32436.1 primosomal protein N' [Plasticicumulans sp.]
MQAPILRVAVPSPLPAALDYLAPPGPLPPLVPGLRVRVPLKNGERIGVLLDTAGASELASTKLKPALAILDDTPLLPAELLALGHWAAGYYHHPPGEVFATLLPAALRDGQPPLRRCEPGFRITEAGRLALQEQATG